MNEIENKVREYGLREGILRPGKHVLLALSGGADSVCLLYVLQALSELLSLKLSAVHVHHGLRGETAERDAAFSEALCKEAGIPFTCVRVDTRLRMYETGETMEEAARALRYQALREEKVRLQASAIACAHHMGDQAETILFQMIRGSALRGLSGMRPERDGIIRPLLCLTKEEILSYLREKGASWCEDETNAYEDATRNIIRHKVIPPLCSVRADAVEKISDTGAYLQEVDAFFTERAGVFFTEQALSGPGTVQLPAAAFSALHPLEQDYVVRAALEYLGESMKDKGRVHLRDIAALSEKTVGKTVQISKTLTAVRGYDTIDLYYDREESAEEPVEKEILIREFPFEKGMEIPEKIYTKWFDYDKITADLEVRTRKSGDRISLSSGTHKKLKDYLIDAKVPKAERDRLIVIASGHDVLWVVGYRMSTEYQVTEDTKRILEIQAMPKND